MNDNTYLGRPLIENVPTLEGTRYTNPDADSPLVAEFRRAQQEREQHLRPLRIDSRTTILVRADKCNEAYAAAYRKQASGEQPRGEQAAAGEEHPRRRGGRADRIRREYDEREMCPEGVHQVPPHTAPGRVPPERMQQGRSLQRLQGLPQPDEPGLPETEETEARGLHCPRRE